MYPNLLSSLLLGGLLAVGWSPAAAQSPASKAARPVVAPSHSDSVLLLHSGRILKGIVKRVSTGYLVTSQSGHLAVSAEDVRFAAQDLSEIYLMLRYELKDPTVKEQLKLAEWSFSQKLYNFASRDLLTVLNRDPSNETARRLLKRIDDEESRQPDAGANSVLTRDDSTKPIADDAARSLAGLSTPLAQQFVASIQPLLFNKCGNARCHGSSSDHEFRLTRGSSGAGNHRVYSERNLALLMKYIDLDRPSQSRLLQANQGAHAGQTVFNGRAGADQQKLLRDWVLAAADEIQPAPKQSVARTTSGRQPVFELVEAEVPARTALIATQEPTASGAVTGKTATAKPVVSESERSHIQKLLREDDQDAFSPEEFNRGFADVAR